MSDEVSSSEILKIIKKKPFQQILDGHKVIYSLCEKLNESRIFYNQRFIMLHDSGYLGYSNIESDLIFPFKRFEDIKGNKKIVLLENIKTNNLINNNIQLIVNQPDAILKGQKQLKWIFRFNNAGMAKQWHEIIQIAIKQNENKLKESKEEHSNGIQNISDVQMKSSASSKLLKDSQDLLLDINNQNLQVNTQTQNYQQQKQQIPIPNFSKYTAAKYTATNEEYKNKSDQKQIQSLKSLTFKLSNEVESFNQDDLLKQEQSAFFRNINDNQSVKSSQSEIEQTFELDSTSWNLKFLTMNQYEIIRKFRIYSQKIIIKLIDEYCLPEQRRMYRAKLIKSDYAEYLIQDLLIKVAYCTFKQAQFYKKYKEIVYNQKSNKSINNQFKNMNYILQKTKNIGNLNIGLCNIIQYKGFNCLVKTIIKQINFDFTQQLEIAINKTSNLCKIKKQIFYDKSCLTLLKSELKIFNSRTKNQNFSFQKDDSNLYYIVNLYRFLPQDILYSDQDCQNKQIRAQMLMSWQNNQIQGRDIIASLKKSRIQKQITNSFKNVQELSNQILKIVDSVIKEWESSLIDILYTTEITQLFHKNGLNMRYLGLVYQNSKINIMKKICMSQICARSAKTILRNNLQEDLKNFMTQQQKIKSLNSEKTIQKSNEYLIQRLIENLNSFIGDSNGSEIMWQIINKQSLSNFNVQANRQMLYDKYFLHALIYHCNINIDWNKVDENLQIFKTTSYFRKEIIRGFSTRCKSYDLSYTDQFQQIKNILKKPTDNKVFQQILKLINYKKNYLQNVNLYDEICLKLTNYISPFADKIEIQHNKYLFIYEIGEKYPPTSVSIKILLNKLKWALSFQNKNNFAQNIIENAKQLIKKSCGLYHPILSQFYQLFSIYYTKNDKFQEAITMAKLSIINQLKSFQINHYKIAETYFLIANIYSKVSRKDEAIIHYKKAKIIMQQENKTSQIGYVVICSRLCNLLLNQKNYQQCLLILNGIEEILQKQYINKLQQEYYMIECYELKMRCYEILKMKENQKKLVENCSKYLPKIKQQQNIEKILRIIIYYYLKKIPSASQKRFTSLFQFFKRQKVISRQDSFKYLQYIVRNSNLVISLQEYAIHVESIFEYIEQKSLLSIWKGIQIKPNDPIQSFIGIFQSLYCILGEDFLIQTIKSEYK